METETKERGTGTAVAPNSGEKRLTLYDLTGEYEQLSALLSVHQDGDENDGSDEEPRTAPLEEALGLLQGAIERKAESIAKVIMNHDAEAEWIDNQAGIFQAEADRLRQRAATRRKATDRLRDYLFVNLEALGDETQKINAPLLTITLSKRPAKDKVVITDEAKLPPDCLRAILQMPLAQVPQELREFVKRTEPDKARINEIFGEGIVVPGSEVQPGQRRLRIY